MSSVPVPSLGLAGLCSLIAAHLGQAGAVAPDLRLTEDLGIDSLALHALLIDIEEAGVPLPDADALQAVATVRQLHVLLCQ